MAKIIDYKPPERDPREELYHRLEKAPREHVEALLDLYEIAQLMKDKGVLEVMKGALGAGEGILEILTKTLETDEAISAIQNFTIIAKTLGGINPEVLEKAMRSVSMSVDSLATKEPPSLVRIMGLLSGSGSRRVLGTLAAMLETIGQHLPKLKEPALRGERRLKVTRRRVELVIPNPRD